MTSSQVTAVRDVPTLEGKVSDEEWEARVDLAACYRLAHSHGWNRNIYNHTSHRVPGEPDMFLIKPHVLLWDEITASNLIKVNMHGELDERAGVNRPGYVLHSAILRARPDVNAVVHIHEEASIAVSTMKDGLLPLTQEAIFLYGRVAYHEYSGITEDAEERADGRGREARLQVDLAEEDAELAQVDGAVPVQVHRPAKVGDRGVGAGTGGSVGAGRSARELAARDVLGDVRICQLHALCRRRVALVVTLRSEIENVP